MKQAFAFSMVALGLAFAAGCGAKVVVDAPSEGTGGAGGTTQSSSSNGPASITVSVGPGPMVSSVGPGPGPGPSVVSSTSSGPMSCDFQGDCQFCIECSTNSICNGLWTKCLATPSCDGLLNCLPTCQDQLCFDKCLETFPDGIELYNETAICLVCQSCFNDCDGGGQGCP
ncbi:hypothetical protein [Polyangium sp. y55x31]|uniref:hypothetical protein n=1 Tax=Polyangium sp. y55x31 TaxID=3042688 RepID=UPI002482F987|nr:hypothetical protein [Polyangium sp. y55x31]MDI1477369.1 hypothetical protein [Polyangium sp. y55x31]